MEAALAPLERVQTQILRRISTLEQFFSSSSSHTPTEKSSSTVTRLSSILSKNGVSDFAFKRVAAEYYDWSLESRRDALYAHSANHLCKSIVNNQAPANITDCSDRNNSKYYVVVVQYTAKFNADAVKNFLYTLNDGKIPKKRFNMRLAPEETSIKLTGYEHNAVTCVGMNTDIPVILDEAIVKLNPDFFWLGGGEVDLKLGIRTSEFISLVAQSIRSHISEAHAKFIAKMVSVYVAQSTFQEIHRDGNKLSIILANMVGKPLWTIVILTTPLLLFLLLVFFMLISISLECVNLTLILLM